MKHSFLCFVVCVVGYCNLKFDGSGWKGRLIHGFEISIGNPPSLISSVMVGIFLKNLALRNLILGDGLVVESVSGWGTDGLC